MKAFAILAALTLWCGVAWSQTSPSASKPILSGPLVKLDIKDAKVEPARGKPKGALNIGLHFGLDPGWLDAEMTADFTRAAFRLRPGLKFQDGHPLTTADVKWNYESYRGYNFKVFHDKLDRIEIVDDRVIVFHFKEPFVDFLDLYNGGGSGIGWIAPRHYYERVGKDAHRYWDTVNAPFPWPWEVWEVKG